MLRFPLLYLPAVDGAEEEGEETIKFIALTFFILLEGENRLVLLAYRGFF